MAELCYFTGPMDCGKSTLDADGEEMATAVAYEALCRRHHRRQMTRAVAQATLSDPLPLAEETADDEL